jgi:hypothetical protein
MTTHPLMRSERLHPVHQWTGIGPIGLDMPQTRTCVPQNRQDTCCTVTVLHTGGRHDHHEDQPQRIDEEMTLAPLDVFPLVVATDPPFSVALTG